MEPNTMAECPGQLWCKKGAGLAHYHTYAKDPDLNISSY